MNPESVPKTESNGLRLWLHSETRFAAFGLIVVAIFLLSMWGAAWWSVRTQQDTIRESQTEQARLRGNALARCSEVMLAEGEVTALRRVVTQTAQDGGLTRCRILLPGGGVVADANPSGITLRELPEKWPDGVVTPKTDDPRILVFPLMVTQRGTAALEIVPQEDPVAASYWLTQSGIGAICIGALVVLMVLFRRVRAGLRGMSAVREALLARGGGQTAVEALEVNPNWGPEARAWNELLTQEGSRHKQEAIARTRESFQARQGSPDRLSAACDALAQGLIIIERDMRITFANSAAALLLQAKREDLLSADVTPFLRDERVLAAARAATSGPMQRRMIIEAQRNGEAGTGILRFIIRPVRREDAGVAMIVIEDITQQRAAEEAQHAFVAQATHELRTPLTNIRLYTEMALDEGKSDPAVLANCLNIINQETYRLDRTVADILSITEIESGTQTVHKDDVRLEEIFPELQAGYAAQADEKKIQMVFHLPPKLPVIKGDREKIRVALHNLIGNALKYTQAGGQVSVSVAANDGHLVVSVGDTGIDMSDEDREHVFEKFYRAKDTRVAKITGSGLGLAIAREVVRMHGGDITVESELNRGSTFTLELPIPVEAA
ncbi:MAG: ATP-binding protein [Planctomycetota bacterium]|nr:ATP-binding protein [Planctomycetota bacterium]